MKVAAVILAAGASQRLGEPKQSIRLGSETLLERTVRTARDAGLDPVFAVVTPKLMAELESVLRDPPCLLSNENAAEGIASSLRLGIAAAIRAHAEGVVVLACDQPFITAEHLRRLALGGDHAIASAYSGRKGVPAYFPAEVFSELLRLSGDSGARELLVEAQAIVLKNGEIDIDTAEDLKRARELEASEPPVEKPRGCS